MSEIEIECPCKQFGFNTCCCPNNPKYDIEESYCEFLAREIKEWIMWQYKLDKGRYGEQSRKKA